MLILPCMGGWCQVRESCAHYTAPIIPGMDPVERLCGEDAEPEQVRHILTLRQRAEIARDRQWLRKAAEQMA